MVLSDKRQHLSEKDMRALTAFSVFDSRRGWGWWTGHPCGLLWVRTPPWGLLRRSAEGEAKGEGWLQTEKESDDDRWKMKERLQVKKQKRAKTAMTGVGGGSGDAYYTYNVDWREPSGSPVICWEATLNDFSPPLQLHRGILSSKPFNRTKVNLTASRTAFMNNLSTCGQVVLNI